MAVSSSRCSSVTSSVSSEFVGEAGLAGWTRASRPGSAVFLFKNINIEM